MENDKNPKECLFSFAKINKYFLFPFLAPIFCCLGNIFINLIIEENKEMQLEMLVILVVDATYLMSGLLYFIPVMGAINEENINIEIKNREKMISIDNQTINNNGTLKTQIKIILFLLLISFLMILAEISIVFSIKKTIIENRLYYIFYISFLSKYILKDNIYKHQILSLFISLIGMILLLIPVILLIRKEDIFINLFNFLFSFSLPLYLVLIKYLIHNYYLSPLLCLLFIGIISILYTFIGFASYSLIQYKDFSFIKNNFDFLKKSMGIKFYLYLLLVLIFGSIYQVLNISLIFYFSPTLITVTDTISPMLLWIITSILRGIEENKYKTIFFNTTGYLLQLIAGFIYNEIIICNFCGLNEYTKKKLLEKQNEELISLKRIENSIESEKNRDSNQNDTKNS